MKQTKDILKAILNRLKTSKGRETLTLELIGILATVVIQALYIAYKIGKFEQKLETLDKKQDKHNNLIERMIRVEDSVKSAHKRLDEKY